MLGVAHTQTHKKLRHKDRSSVASSLSGAGGALSLCLAGVDDRSATCVQKKNPAREEKFENKCAPSAFPRQLLKGNSGGVVGERTTELKKRRPW
jgi:hypothetical protein